jgi:hypothetical protein
MRAVRLPSSLVSPVSLVKRTILVAGLVQLGLLASSADVRAQSPHRSESEACFEAAEHAQPLLKDRKLRAAARELTVCARDVCPRAARTDCRAWLDELSRAQPTVVFRARESRPAGDVAVDDVRISVDGESLVPQRIDEAPVPVDPGSHTFRFEHGDFPPIDQHLDLREGETRRIVDIVFRHPGSAPTPPPVPATSSSSATPTSTSPPPSNTASTDLDSRDGTPAPTATWFLLGGSALALGVGIAFEATGLSARSKLAGTCGATRSCAQSGVDSARSQVLAGDIGVGVGVALLLGAAYVYFTRAPSTSSPDSAALHLGFSPIPGGFAGTLAGSL